MLPECFPPLGGNQGIESRKPFSPVYSSFTSKIVMMSEVKSCRWQHLVRRTDWLSTGLRSAFMILSHEHTAGLYSHLSFGFDRYQIQSQEDSKERRHSHTIGGLQESDDQSDLPSPPPLSMSLAGKAPLTNIG